MTVLTRVAELDTAEVPAFPPAAPSGAAAAPAPLRPDDGLALVASGTPASRAPDIVDQWGMASFPASDPPANW